MFDSFSQSTITLSGYTQYNINGTWTPADDNITNYSATANPNACVFKCPSGRQRSGTAQSCLLPPPPATCVSYPDQYASQPATNTANGCTL